MFSSLASYLFGSNTNCETNSETNPTTTAAGKNAEVKLNENKRRCDSNVDADNFIEVTSLTPSVTGTTIASARTGQRDQVITNKRGKNRRNNARQQNKRSKGGAKATSPLRSSTQHQLPAAGDSCDEEFDEDEWFIVEKEDEETDDSPTRCDSEGENVPVIDVAKTARPIVAVAANTAVTQQRRLQHINSHSLYSGPRPQKQRNYFQKTRNNNNRISSNNGGLSVSSLSTSRTVDDGRNASGQSGEATADSCMSRSLYVAAAAVTNADKDDEMTGAATGTNGDIVEANNKMDESWFVTPPSCFTSIGPINMEISPFENLLIEHPSMSVYHSIKTAQEATESFIKLDIGVNDMNEKQKVNETTPKKNTQAVQTRNTTAGYRLDRQTAAQLKQEVMARNVQKIQTKKERKDICRSAIKRANKVRDVQSRNHTQRRSDRQHSRIFSNANNNRKSNSH